MPPLTDKLLNGTFTVDPPGLFTIMSGLKLDLSKISFTCTAVSVGK